VSGSEAKLLLIAGDWQFRALVRAQLIEAGYEVMAFPRLDVALLYLVRGGVPPRLTIVDLPGLDANVSTLVDLRRLSGEAPLLLCGGMLDRAVIEAEELRPARVLMRPFSVGDVVSEVRRMDTWTGTQTGGA